VKVERLEGAQLGQVRYSRYYAYNLDGSRAMVMRDDALDGTHWDMYSYDEVSGRLASVQDVWTGEVHRFVWNPEGTLARWSDASALYDRVYSYDEEGRLVRIGWDDRDGRERARHEYRYNSDGFKVWEREWFETEMGWRAFAYRFVCGIGCGWLPLVTYRDYDGADEWAIWERYEWTTDLLRGFWYEGYEFGSTFTWRNLDYELLAGYLWVADLWLDFPGGGFRMRYWDRYGVEVGERLYPEKVKRQSFWRRENNDLPMKYLLRNIPNNLAIPPTGVWPLDMLVCSSVANRLGDREVGEVHIWHEENFKPSEDFDKFKHCLTTCLIGLEAGDLCATIVSYSEREFPFPFAPLQNGGEIADELANLSGRDCARDILTERYPGWGVYGNIYNNHDNWEACINCCLGKGYHPGEIKWRLR